MILLIVINRSSYRVFIPICIIILQHFPNHGNQIYRPRLTYYRKYRVIYSRRHRFPTRITIINQIIVTRILKMKSRHYDTCTLRIYFLPKRNRFGKSGRIQYNTSIFIITENHNFFQFRQKPIQWFNKSYLRRINQRLHFGSIHVFHQFPGIPT